MFHVRGSSVEDEEAEDEEERGRGGEPVVVDVERGEGRWGIVGGGEEGSWESVNRGHWGWGRGVAVVLRRGQQMRGGILESMLVFAIYIMKGKVWLFKLGDGPGEKHEKLTG